MGYVPWNQNILFLVLPGFVWLDRRPVGANRRCPAAPLEGEGPGFRTVARVAMSSGPLARCGHKALEEP